MQGLNCIESNCPALQIPWGTSFVGDLHGGPDLNS